MATDNRLLGEFNLEDIPPAPRGVPQIEVKFDIDANGILNVAAKELKSGKEASVRIEGSSGLSKDEIDTMQRDAEKHSTDDRKKRELAEERNKADHLVYQLEKLMSEHKDKLSDSDREPVATAIEKLRTAAKGEDLDAIKSALRELEPIQEAFTKLLYEKTQASSSDQSDADATEETSSDDEAIDAEFEVKE